MKIWTSSFYKRVFVFTTFLCACVSSAFAEQAPNPRGSGVAAETSVAADSIGVTARSTTTNRVVRNSGNVVSGVSSGRSSTTGVSRSATVARPSTTVSRSAALPSSSSSNVVTGRSGTVVQTVSSGQPTSARSATVSRSATTNVVNGASRSPASTARAAATNSVVGLSRGAATARATAVFSDISAIGSGYSKCREAYATCMDQFCANANDTYRRCVCSAKYDEFRNTESAIDEALNLLAQFEDNNLAAVELSAEEVNAMYSATEGEMAIKSDTSAAASMLAEINDLLAGRKSVETTDLSSSSLGLLNIDFTSDLDDIWGGTGTSIFDSSTGVDLSSLTGEDLYTQASKQCLEIVADSCENDAVLTMARSAYGIMVTQDCNLYEKNINAQKESLEQTVRTAEKYLREARLSEYQSHNSADVNECISNVRSAILSDAACGPNYERCLDYTGAYINQSTGEPRFSPRLFQLADLITLPGVTSTSSAGEDVLGANAAFNTFLDSRRMFAESALDSCRDMADIVWEEFKRQALIEIAQAQDEKIEEVKMSCVSTMAECYDTQTGALQDFDNTTSQYTGALSATAARAMCEDKVIACASLYGNTDGCKFDGNGKLVTGNSAGAGAEQLCGLTALLSFVGTVDNIRIAEGCETAINNYLKDLCTPTSGTNEYPWNCVTLTEDALNTNLENFVRQNCAAGGDDISSFSVQMAKAKEDFYENMDYILMDTCESLNGYWVGRGDNVDSRTENADNLTSFYRAVYGGNENANWGRCVENTTMIQCLSYNEDDQEPVASYDLASDECTFTEAWYKSRCAMLNDGYYEKGVCYSVSEN